MRLGEISVCVVLFVQLQCTPITPFDRLYCLPDNSCWPNAEAIAQFHRRLTGTVVEPRDPQYKKLLYQINPHYTRYPGLIALVETGRDVRLSVAFGRHYNIRLSLYSCGHDYACGRSAANNSLQINMSRMKGVKVKTTEPASVWAQSGATWKRVYHEVTRYGKQVVGGGCTNVCVAGYTMGGGVSVLSRTHGLAVDNVLNFDIVLYNGTTARCSDSGTVLWDPDGRLRRTSDSDLFWAVRGGGGGTFGVVLSFTFALHDAPRSLVRYETYYPLKIVGNSNSGKEVVSFILKFLSKLPSQWGGYLTTFKYDSDSVKSVVGVILLQNGAWADHRSTATVIREIDNYRSDLVLYSRLFNLTTIEDHNRLMVFPTTLQTLSLTANVKFNSSDSRLVELLTQYSGKSTVEGIEYSCAMTLIGGKITNIDASKAAISRKFREADLTASCDVLWKNRSVDDDVISLAASLDEKLLAVSDSSYLNEGYGLVGSWKTRYWSENYVRLLEVKRRDDPYGVFTCHHCVGSDD